LIDDISTFAPISDVVSESSEYDAGFAGFKPTELLKPPAISPIALFEEKTLERKYPRPNREYGETLCAEDSVKKTRPKIRKAKRCNLIVIMIEYMI
jgi:hypothetical protein